MQFVKDILIRAKDNNFFDPENSQTPGLQAQVLYRLKELLKSVGWVVQASSDGTTFNTTPGNVNDVITSAVLMNNTLAWFVIKKPDDNRQLCFQVEQKVPVTPTFPNSTGFRIKYSLSNGFVAGTPSAIETPHANDEEFPLGMYGANPARFGTDASPQFQNWLGFQSTGTIVHMAADNAAPFGWWVAGYGMRGDGNYSDEGVFAGVFDPLINTVSGDPDPYAFYFSWVGQPWKTELNYNAQPGYCACWGFIDQGGPVELWAPIAAPFPVAIYDNRRTQNPINNKVDRWPLVYGTPMVWPNYYDGAITHPQVPYSSTDEFVLSARGLPRGHKGVSTMMQWCLANLSIGQTIKVSTSRDKIVIGNVILDWDGSVPRT